MLRPVLRPLSRVAFRPEVHGAGNVPRVGPVILAANHLSVVDSFLIPLVTPRRVSFLAKEEYFRGGNPKRWVTRAFIEGIDAIPVPRGGYRAAQESLEAALRVLEGGGAFGIHPEGSRSRDGRLYRGRTGVAWLAIASGAPVVPVALLGTDRIQPVGARLPKPGKLVVHFGDPMIFPKPADGRLAPARRRATDQIMAAIAGLSGQEVAPEYNELSAGSGL
jgi:1-acyl-sn-glycerol-3-phosphate acyltransferase